MPGDGFKPGTAPRLYDMSELRSSVPTSRTGKSARVLFYDTMGKYHPHGDSLIYETLVVPAPGLQERNAERNGTETSVPLTGAAMRYTEARVPEICGGSLFKGFGQDRPVCAELAMRRRKEPEVPSGPCANLSDQRCGGNCG